MVIDGFDILPIVEPYSLDLLTKRVTDPPLSISVESVGAPTYIEQFVGHTLTAYPNSLADVLVAWLNVPASTKLLVSTSIMSPMSTVASVRVIVLLALVYEPLYKKSALLNCSTLLTVTVG